MEAFSIPDPEALAALASEFFRAFPQSPALGGAPIAANPQAAGASLPAGASGPSTPSAVPLGGYPPVQVHMAATPQASGPSAPAFYFLEFANPPDTLNLDPPRAEPLPKAGASAHPAFDVLSVRSDFPILREFLQARRHLIESHFQRARNATPIVLTTERRAHIHNDGCITLTDQALQLLDGDAR